MQKDDSVPSAGTNADSSTGGQDMQSTGHDTKPLVVGSPSLPDDDIWSHPMNKGVPQKNIQFYETMKSYIDNAPKNENGQPIIIGSEFEALMSAMGAVPIGMSSKVPF